MNDLVLKKNAISLALTLLEQATKDMPLPMSVKLVQEYGRDPFIVLISCLLSLRARDVVTYDICRELFSFVRTPEQLIAVDRKELEALFYRLGFYRQKAKIVQEVSHELIERFNGKVPSNEADLLTLKGVGRKTANLVLGEGFEIPALCVDTHVHQVANRLGWVNTTNPHDTETELKKLIDQDKWIAVNHYLVIWGQAICVPISPWCSRCILNPICPKKGVGKRR